MPRQRKPHKGLVVKRGISGLGLFTTLPIKKDEFIVEYTGTLLTNEESDKKGGKYLFEVNDDWAIDGTGRENLARYINHSCKPNAEPEVDGRRVYIYALRHIREGEEVAYDYGDEYFDDFIGKSKCQCAHCMKQKEKRRRRT